MGRAAANGDGDNAMFGRTLLYGRLRRSDACRICLGILAARIQPPRRAWMYHPSGHPQGGGDVAAEGRWNGE
jgi:hypothetical protein